MMRPTLTRAPVAAAAPWRRSTYGAAGKGFASPQPEPLRPSPSAAGASGASAAATRLACTACDRSSSTGPP
uniref:Secreted protein n=1 Tax=Macrostomum lignano TaxID=282301 RepID=A0A1I8HFY5_9PLAT